MLRSTSPSRLAQPEVLDDLLLYRLGRLVGTSGTMVIRLCEGGFGITRREWRAIASLGRSTGAVRPSQLSEHIGLDRARTSRAITSMVAKGLVRRESAPADRREALLSLTPQGQALYDRLMPTVRALNRELLSVLGPEEIEGLDSMLARQQAQAGAMAGWAELPKADRRRGGRAPHPLGGYAWAGTRLKALRGTAVADGCAGASRSHGFPCSYSGMQTWPTGCAQRGHHDAGHPVDGASTRPLAFSRKDLR